MMPSVVDVKMTEDMTDDRMSRLAKAAYLMVKGSLAEDISSKHELMEAMQFAGKPFTLIHIFHNAQD